MNKRKEYNKKYYFQNKEKILEEKQQYYIQNKEKLSEDKKEIYKNNKDTIKQISNKYYENNINIILTKRKHFYNENRDKIIQKQKLYTENNKEKKKKYNIEYYQENKEILIHKAKENQKCKTCKLFYVKKKTNWLCTYCNSHKPTRQKTKELKVKAFLEENNYKFIYNKKCNLDKSCQTYYPDFLIDKDTFFLVIECDEDAHNSYPIDCEKISENNICFALGLPCVFIRFNPDKKKIKMKTKQKVLKSYVDYYMIKENSDNEVCYLFY